MLKFLTNTYAKYQGLGITASFFNFFQGRATTFAIFFTAVGTYMAFHHELTADYVAFIGAIQSLVFAHSCKEDWCEMKRKFLDKK